MCSQQSKSRKRDDHDTQHARPASLARICYSCLCASKFNSQHLGINADVTAPMQAPLNACSHPTTEQQDETHAYGYNRHRKLRTSCSCKVRVECIHNGGRRFCFLDRPTLTFCCLNGTSTAFKQQVSRGYQLVEQQANLPSPLGRGAAVSRLS